MIKAKDTLNIRKKVHNKQNMYISKNAGGYREISFLYFSWAGKMMTLVDCVSYVYIIKCIKQIPQKYMKKDTLKNTINISKIRISLEP